MSEIEKFFHLQKRIFNSDCQFACNSCNMYIIIPFKYHLNAVLFLPCYCLLQQQKIEINFGKLKMDL